MSQFNNDRISLVVLLIVCCSLVLFFNCQSISGTSSTCRGPSDTSSSARRGAAATLETELNEMIEAELLNAHVTLAEQGLDAEDLEYFTQLTTEHIHNTLLFRRLFRRIGRIVRRIGRAIGRVFRAIGGLFRRRRAREIIMNSVSNFNGYTGPNKEALELRRPFIGGGAQARAVVSAATTLGFFRRRHRRHHRVISSVRPSFAPSTPSAPSGIASRFRKFRPSAPVSAPVSRPVSTPVSRPAAIVARRSSRRSRRRNAIFTKIGNGIKRFAGKVGAVARKVKTSLKSKMIALEQSNASDGNHPVNCVACRVDCLRDYSAIGGSMFSSCGQRYYYYGCQAVKPCFDTKTASDDEIEGMIGICAYRNDCKFKSEWKAVSDDQILADRLVGRVRGSSGVNPE